MTGNTRRREAEDSSLFLVTEIRAGRRLREDRDSGGPQVAGARKKEQASLVHFALLLLVLPLSLWVHCFLQGASDGSWKASPTSPLTVTVGARKARAHLPRGRKPPARDLFPLRGPALHPTSTRSTFWPVLHFPHLSLSPQYRDPSP